jgi:nucleotide-binding universal stress UspA family protein
MLKDVVVHLTGSDEDQTRIDHAAAIARTFDAHLTGLQTHVMPELLAITDPAASSFLQELIAESVERAKSVSERLRESLGSLGLRHELRRLDLYPGETGVALATEARACDLFVGTRPYGDPSRGERVEESVLFGSGRGCLFIPPRLDAPKNYDTVLIAWNNTREAAHAVAEALPFLSKAQQVVVAIVEEAGASEQFKKEPGADIGRHLSRHGVRAEIRHIDGWSDPAEALLNETRAIGADLVVMGAYGHSRFREWMAGGVTRRMLSDCPVPVLVVH